MAAVMVSEPKPSLELPSFRSDLHSLSDQSSSDDDLYSRLKSLQRQLEFIDIHEEYVKDEQKNLKRELLRAQEEVKRIQSVPLVIGQFMEMVDQNNGIVGSTTGSNYYVRILSTINRELLKPSASVALHRHSNPLVDVLKPLAKYVILYVSPFENLKLFILSCFFLAWKMIYPDECDTPAFLIKIESPYLITDINAMEHDIDQWLQRRQCKRPITSLAFLDFFISHVNHRRFPLLKNFATHRAYEQQNSIEYTLFRLSILAATAIIYSCGKFYEKYYKLFEKSICESDHIDPHRLREALGVMTKPLIQNIQPSTLNDDDYEYDVDDDDDPDDDDEFYNDCMPTDDDEPRPLPRVALFHDNAPNSSSRTQLFPGKRTRDAPSSYSPTQPFHDGEPSEDLASSFPCSQPLRDADHTDAARSSFPHQGSSFRDNEPVNHAVPSSRPCLPLHRDPEPTDAAALRSSSCGRAQNVVQGNKNLSSEAGKSSNSCSTAHPTIPRLQFIMSGTSSDGSRLRFTMSGTCSDGSRLRFTMSGNAIRPIGSGEQATAVAESRSKHDTTDSLADDRFPKRRRFAG